MNFFRSKKTVITTFIIAILLLSSAQLTYAATPDQIREVAGEFICNCGCTKLLTVCDMSYAQDLKKKIAVKIDAGWDKERIMNYMTKNFGDAILAAPRKRGFNLLAWVTPFVLIGLGAIGIYTAIFLWIKAGRKNAEEAKIMEEAEPKQSSEKSKKDDEKYQKTIDDELDKIDW